MSDTPETDKAERMAFSSEYMVPAEFARQLERERDEAISSRKESAADWLNQVEQANARVSRALQQVAIAERERDNWEQTAAHYLEGMHYYRGLVERVGEALGEAAYTQDDGGKVDSVLCAKVPELVVDLKRERDEAREKIKRQAERIRELEGATNHAGGLPKYHGTDETDAMVERWQSAHIPAGFARRMEFERNEALRKAEERLTQLTAITNSEPRDYMALVTACRVHKDHIAQLAKERDEAREVLREIAEASHFDNIGNWARNKAKEALK